MKKTNFEDLLLHNKIIDHRNLYVLVAKRRPIFPSLSILVMGLYKEKLVFFKISTSYRLIKFIEDIELKDINEFEIKTKTSNSILKIKVNKTMKNYDIVEHDKDVYSIKKILKK